jgi:hypothetical protein
MSKSFSVVGGFQKIPKNSKRGDDDYYDSSSKKKDRSKRKQIKSLHQNLEKHPEDDKSLDENYSEDYEFVDVND